MPRCVVGLPVMASTAGGTNSNAIEHVDDAVVIGIILNSTTTSGANIATVQVEMSSSGTNFVPLAYMTSGASAITVSSSQPVWISNQVGFKQMRMAATGAMLAAINYVASKQIIV